ncbi:MAG: family 16 glycosylhydrolase [Treponema sp.]|jgi:beta-glucanase (GH16 family)|nr:family 16 glycosylhydrolase [Treponema sp.]
MKTKRNARKISAIGAALLMAAAFIGCDGNGNDTSDNGDGTGKGPNTPQSTVISEKNLSSLVKKPVYGESPVTTAIDTTQYSSAAIVWTYAGGGAVSGTFNASADIAAAFTLAPKSGYTFAGFTGPFTHTGAKNVSHQKAENKVTVTVTFEKLPTTPPAPPAPQEKWVLAGSSGAGSDKSEIRTNAAFYLQPNTVYEVEANYKIINALFVVRLVGNTDYAAGNWAIDGQASATLNGKTLTGDGFELDGVYVAPWWGPGGNFDLFFGGDNDAWHTKKIRIKTKVGFNGSENPHLIIRFNDNDYDGAINYGDRAWVNYVCVRKVDSGTLNGAVTGKNLVTNAAWDDASATSAPYGWTYDDLEGMAAFKRTVATVPAYVTDVETPPVIPPPPLGEVKVKFYNPGQDPFKVPVTGNYPQTLFDYPFTGFGKLCEGYSQTLEWLPDVDYVFLPNTEYTARITFKKFNQIAWMTYTAYNGNLNQLEISNVGGLPNGGTSYKGYASGDNYVVEIRFPKTGAARGTRELLFSEDFSGTSLDTSKWDDTANESRQGKSSWRGNKRISVSGGNLAIGAYKVNEIWYGDNPGSDADWIETGCVRTGMRIDNDAKWEHSYGYYEARIKPMKRYLNDRNVPWGAFWLTGRLVTEWGGRDQESFKYSAKIGTEIDILETIHNDELGGHNAALHWNGYDFNPVNGLRLHRGRTLGNGPDNWFQSNIYDGNFHTFALDWSPKKYKFYVDGKLFWELTEGDYALHDNEPTWVYICRNPLYIKLSIEAANFQNEGKNPFWPTGWLNDKMEVDYVKVWNQPPQ